MTAGSQAALRRLFRVVNGGTPTSEDDNWDGGIHWATPVDLGRVHGDCLDGTDRTLSAEGLRSGSAAVPAGSLIVSTRAPIGYVAETTTLTAFNQGCKGLVPVEPLDIRFYRYVVVGMSSRLQAWGQGSTFVELSGDALAEQRVPTPTLGTQRAIADFLDTETARIDALIAKKRRMIDLFGLRRRSALDQLFTQLGRVPYATLGRFVVSLTQGVSPQASNVPASDGEFGLLKLSAVKAGRFVPTENKALAADFEFDRGLVPKVGDLLVTRSNTPAYVGDVCVVDGEAPVVLCDLIYRLRLDDRLAPSFAALALMRSEGRRHLAAAARGTSQTMVKLRGEDVKAATVPVVPSAVQLAVIDQFAEWEAHHEGLHKRVSRQIALLQEHRQALIIAAVTGELEIPGVAA